MAVLFAILALALGTVDYLTDYSLNHNTSWFLIATRMWLDGAELYRDVVELNPPLIFYLTAIPLHLADLTGLDDTSSMILCLCALGTISLWACRLVLMQTELPRGARWLVLAACGAGLFVVPVAPFGQREHLMVLFALPYVLTHLARPLGTEAGQAMETKLALFALPRLLLKPYFLTLPLAFTLVRMISNRSLRSVLALPNLVIGAGAVAYLASILWAHPHYVNEVVPLARSVYGAYGAERTQVLLLSTLFSLPVLMLAWVLLRTPERPDRAGLMLLVGTTAMAISYLVQFNGFAYHALPLDVLTLVTATYLLADGKHRLRARPWVVLVLLVPLTVPFWETVKKGRYQTRLTQQIHQFLPDDHRGQTIVVYSTNVWRSFPLVNRTGMRWTSRYPAQWLVPGAVRLLASDTATPAQKEEASGVLDHARRTAVEDFLRHRPKIVIFDVRHQKSYFGGHDFDYRTFLSQDPSFAEAWQDYRHNVTVSAMEIWERR